MTVRIQNAKTCIAGCYILACSFLVTACDQLELGPAEEAPSEPVTKAIVPPPEPEAVETETLDYKIRVFPGSFAGEYRLAITGDLAEEDVDKIEEMVISLEDAWEILETKKTMHIEVLSPTEATVMVGPGSEFYVTLIKLAGIWSITEQGQGVE
jgi:hypothetical protein